MTWSVMIRRGEGWGGPVTGPSDVEVAGDDAALAAAVGAAVTTDRAPRVRFDASTRSDLARAVGLVGTGAGTVEIPLDVVALDVVDGDAVEPGATLLDLAVNAVVVGPPPDRLRWWHRRRPCTVLVDGRTVFDGTATTVLVANGQFLRGHDVVPAGHPGDARIEVQVYALDPSERAPMRRRLAGAAHIPHPRIATAAGASVTVSIARPEPLEVDGRRRGSVRQVQAIVRPEAYRLLV